MADKTVKKDTAIAILITNVLEEVLSLADWVITVVHPWAEKESKLAENLFSHKDDDTVTGLFCQMIGKIIREESMECKFCPLYLHGFLANKETKDHMKKYGDRPQTMRFGRLSGTSHDGCLAVHASIVSGEWDCKQSEEDAKEFLWLLICVLNPLQLTFLFGTRNYFGKLIKKDMETGSSNSIFNPLEEQEARVGDIRKLFNPIIDIPKEKKEE